MLKKVVFLYSGQGSQYYHMGEELFENCPAFNKWMLQLDDIAKSIIGKSIIDDIYDDEKSKHDQFDRTLFSNPAIFMVEYALTQVLLDKGIKPDYLLGASLGEYASAAVAGILDYGEILELLIKQATILEEHSLPGGMLAILSDSNLYKNDQIISENSELAGVNFDSHFVVSGGANNLKLIQNHLKENIINYQALPVTIPFHSASIDICKPKYAEILKKRSYKPARIPLISCSKAKVLNKIDNDYLWDVIRKPILFQETICNIEEQDDYVYVDLSPSGTLSAFVKYNLQSHSASDNFAILTLFGTDLKNLSKVETFFNENNLIKKRDNQLVVPEDGKDKAQLIKNDDKAVKSSKSLSVKQNRRKSLENGKSAKQIMNITAESLGAEEYKKRYNLKYAYAAGGMHKGIASKEMVVRIGKAGMISYLGTGGVSLEKIEQDIINIQKELNNGEAYGVNLLNSSYEETTVDLLLKYGVKNIEASAYIKISQHLARYRLKGLKLGEDGAISITNRIMAKVSRPEVAEAFLRPAPERIVKKLLETNIITKDEAEMSRDVPMADDLCVEADSGGHTDHGMAYVLMPVMIKLREEMREKYRYATNVMLGSAGGIGTPEAAAAAFIMGADFILTGSINQSAVEAKTSDAVKDLLEQINVQDTAYAPAQEMFELGAKAQVVRKGTLFPARANKLYALYQKHNSLDELDEKTRKQLEEKYFKRSFNEIYEDCKTQYSQAEIDLADKNPKNKMALVFKWYFIKSTDFALSGDIDRKVDYQIQCGPSLGAFNQMVKGTELESWRNRHVDEIGEKIMIETVALLNNRFNSVIKCAG